METLSKQLNDFYTALLERTDPSMAAVIGRAKEALFTVNYEKRARQVGEVAPGFVLPDQSGQAVSLDSLLARGPLLLMFFRGGWCPFCAMSLRAMALIRPQLLQLGAELVAVSPETSDQAMVTANRNGLKFPLLSDHDNAVARLYGVDWSLDPEMRSVYARLGHDVPAVNGTQKWELPIPASFVVAPDGRISSRHVDPMIQRRIEPQLALEAVRELVATH